MKIIDLNNKAWQWAVLISLSMIWGSSFILMKRGLESYTSMQVGSMRIFFSFIFLLPFAYKRIKKVSKKNIKSLFLVGFTGNLIPALLFAEAQTEISSSLAGMLNTSTPLFVMIIGVYVYKTKIKHNKIVGILIGLVGALGLVLIKGENMSSGNNWFAGLVLIANICYAISLNEIKLNLTKLDGITITIMAFMFTGPFAGTYLLFSDYTKALTTPDYLENLGYIAVLALLSSAVAVSVFYVFLEYVDVIFASSVTYIIPIFAMLWGVIDGEKVTFYQVIFMTIIFFGVYIVNKNGESKIKKKPTYN